MADNITYCIYNSDAYNIADTALNILLYSYADLKSDWEKSDYMRLPYSKCYCILNGEANLVTKEKTIKMTAGNIYIIPSGFPCGYSCEKEASKIYFHFRLSHNLSHDVFSAAKEILILEDRKEFIDKLYAVFKEESFSRSIETKKYLYEICVEAIKKYNIDEHSFPKYSDTLKKALHLIHENLNINYKCKQLASALNLSERTLENIFKSELASTPNQYIKSAVLNQAASDLLLTDLLVSEISQKYGFSDQFYFSRVFKSKFVVSPEKYRKPLT